MTDPTPTPPPYNPQWETTDEDLYQEYCDFARQCVRRNGEHLTYTYIIMWFYDRPGFASMTVNSGAFSFDYGKRMKPLPMERPRYARSSIRDRCMGALLISEFEEERLEWRQIDVDGITGLIQLEMVHPDDVVAETTSGEDSDSGSSSSTESAAKRAISDWLSDSESSN